MADAGALSRGATSRATVQARQKGGPWRISTSWSAGSARRAAPRSYHLARRGVRVLGLERFAPGHDRGSSHGETRIFRLGYFEHPSYVPLVRRAHALWRELEAAAGRPLLHVTGIAEIGPPDGVLVRGTLAVRAAARPARTRCSPRPS